MNSGRLRRRTLLAVLVSVTCIVGLTGCASKKGLPNGGLPAIARMTALETDHAFARLAMQIPPGEAFARYTDPMSVELPPAGPPVVGTESIRAGLAGVPTGGLQWQPQGGETARSGDMAWTWGNYLLNGRNGPVTGKYLSIWHLRPDGTWGLAVDISNEVLTPPPQVLPPPDAQPAPVQ